MRVLLVENHPTTQWLAMSALRDAGAMVGLASNGQQAVNALRSPPAANPFHAIIMDLQMPVMNGIEATRAIRAMGRNSAGDRPGLSTLPIIAITASALAEDRAECLAAGVTVYATKPMTPDKLVELLAKFAPGASAAPAAPPPAKPVPQADESSPRLAGVAAAGFNVERTLAMTGGEQELLRTLGDFMPNAASASNRARDLLAQNDAVSARRALHDVKGIAAILGADKIREAATAAENAIIKNNGEWEPHLTELDDLIKKAKLELARLP